MFGWRFRSLSVVCGSWCIIKDHYSVFGWRFRSLSAACGSWCIIRFTVLCGDGVFGASLSCRSWCIILCGDDTLEAVVLGGSLFCL